MATDAHKRSWFGPGAASAERAIRCPMLWQTMQVLKELLGPIFSFQSWIQGCPCHEELVLQEGLRQACPWKGCRAPQIAQKVREVSQAIGDAAVAQGPGVEDRVHAIAAAVGTTGLGKFAFLEDLPLSGRQHPRGGSRDGDSGV